MPYNTTAIPPRKEVTGQTMLPLSRVKKIIAQDTDISMCSNNAAFIITLATEKFIQYLAQEGNRHAKMDRKPRRNIQYKDLASAVAYQGNLEFLEDIIPKTVPYKKIKEAAAAKRAELTGAKPAQGGSSADGVGSSSSSGGPNPNAGKKQKSLANGGGGGSASANGSFVARKELSEDPNEQLELEMRQAAAADASRDVEMTD